MQGEVYTLSEMSGKVVLLDVLGHRVWSLQHGDSEVKIVHERFREVDDVVVWGINSGETPHQVQKFLDEHQPPVARVA